MLTRGAAPTEVWIASSWGLTKARALRTTASMNDTLPLAHMEARTRRGAWAGGASDSGCRGEGVGGDGLGGGTPLPSSTMASQWCAAWCESKVARLPSARLPALRTYGHWQAAAHDVDMVMFASVTLQTVATPFKPPSTLPMHVSVEPPHRKRPEHSSTIHTAHVSSALTAQPYRSVHALAVCWPAAVNLFGGDEPALGSSSSNVQLQSQSIAASGGRGNGGGGRGDGGGA